jgi:hypothetical protein
MQRDDDDDDDESTCDCNVIATKENTKVYLFDCKHPQSCNMYIHTHVQLSDRAFSLLLFIPPIAYV